MAKLQDLRTDKELSTKGIWVPFVFDIEFLIGRSGTLEYDRTIRELTRPHLHLYKQSLPQGVIDEITYRAMARHCLLGWRNLDEDVPPVSEDERDGTKIRDGLYRPLANGLYQEIIPYSEDKAFELLKDPESYDLYRFVVAVSNDQTIYRAKRKKEELGN